MLPRIESPHNPKIKRALRLRQAGYRRQCGRFLVDGAREIARAVNHGIHIESLYFAEQHGLDEAMASALSSCLQPVSTKIASLISYGQRADYPVAVAVTPTRQLSQLELPTNCLLLVLDRTEKPGNLGACLRSAAAAGVDAVILSEPICELFNPNTIRASRGAVFGIPLAIAPADEIQRFCAAREIQLLAARVDADCELWESNFLPATALVFGNEAEGLGNNWPQVTQTSFRIPMRQATDSLNLSIAAAVSIYEAVRQRRM